MALLMPPLARQSLPAVSSVTAANHVEFKGADKIVLVAYLEESDATNIGTYNDFAESHRDDYLFGLSHDPTAISEAGIVPPAMVMYKTFDEGRNDFSASFTRESLASFVQEHAVPLLDEISPENFATYAEAGIPLAYIFIPSDDSNRATLVKSLEPVAREYKGKVNFVWIDTNKVRRLFML
jgi:protein disulfide-isomerase A1